MPTFNEAPNILKILEAVREVTAADILVVDDNSPDGTAEIVKEQQKRDQRLHILLQSQKMGLARAYINGFRWGLDRDYHGFIQMDADHTHNPHDLPKLERALHSFDFVVGSRLVKGAQKWQGSQYRKILSAGGNLYSRALLGAKVKDWTSGFNAWQRRALEDIDLGGIQSQGYCFQIEMKHKALTKGFTIFEVPIDFGARQAGKSKFSLPIVSEAVIKVWKMRRGGT